ncbi:MAG: C-type lectin domain-containing protein [Faecalibacterium sp.]|nr:C-type lectin domain-containing protein [Ruminococcus sp.]MCM1392013.1 C-type lectin domain-containing protein [Ruminococcus sp.]MCM1485727.1 C-type lectin domain-containing protein [Faecalibacterium sp.]
MRKSLTRTLACIMAVIMCICGLPMGNVNVTARAASSIPSDAVEFNGSYYKLYDETTNWSEANSKCKSLGGHLVTITSSAEQNFVSGLTTSMERAVVWIGATKSGSTWTWITGEPWGYENWNVGENEPSGDGNYVQMITKLDGSHNLAIGAWNDKYSIKRPGDFWGDVGFICEWEKKLPKGYDFQKDSYNFENRGESISEKYFTTIYESGPGKQLYENQSKVSNGGLCFGMAYTTAAIYNGLPSATSIYNNHIFSDSTYCDVLRDASKSSMLMCGNNEISVKDYIKYAFIYQMSSEVSDSSMATWGDISGLKKLVQSFLNNDLICVTIGLSHYVQDKNGKRKKDSGHRVLAVGIDGNDILIDDPNNMKSLERLTINDDGSWSFSGGWSSEDTLIRYQTDIYRPYQILLTGKKATVNPALLEDDTVETYIESMERLDSDKVLLSVDCNDNYTISCSDYVEIADCDGVDTAVSNNTTDMYWISNDKTVTVSDIKGENNTVSLAGDDTIIDATVTEGSAVTMTIDEDDINAQLDTQIGAKCELSFESTGTDEEDIVIAVSGTSSASEVTATQTETGIIVTGLSNGTVTLSKDDEIISTQEITDAVSDIEITYDKDGSTDDMNVSYDVAEHEHTDADNDGKCDTCGEEIATAQPEACSCICHKGGKVYKIINKIVRVFWKLFRINQTCACGKRHY